RQLHDAETPAVCHLRRELATRARSAGPTEAWSLRRLLAQLNGVMREVALGEDRRSDEVERPAPELLYENRELLNAELGDSVDQVLGLELVDRTYSAREIHDRVPATFS